jgi:hypothetical protein
MEEILSCQDWYYSNKRKRGMTAFEIGKGYAKYITEKQSEFLSNHFIKNSYHEYIIEALTVFNEKLNK